MRRTFLSRAAFRRGIAGLVCLFTLISMVNIVLPVSAADGDSTAMHYIVRAWRSDGTYEQKNGYVYQKGAGGYEWTGELKPEQGVPDTIIVTPNSLGVSDEEFQGFSISAGQDAASINEDGNLVIKYNPNVHIVKAHAFFKSAGVQVAGSTDEAVYGGTTEDLNNLEQDTAAAWGYPEGTKDASTTADLSKTPVTDESGNYIMKSANNAEAEAKARVEARLTNNEITVTGSTEGTINWETTKLTDAKVYKTTDGLHTDKTASVLNEDDRTYQLDLESWFVGNNKADVGLILDASGSMAFSSASDEDEGFEKIETTGKMFGGNDTKDDPHLTDRETIIDEASNEGTEMVEGKQILTDDEVGQIFRDHAPAESQGTVDSTKYTDNSSLSYTGYSYYIFDKRATTNEYVPIGYWDGKNVHYTNEVPTEPDDEGMPGYDNLAGYYDMQKGVLFPDGREHDTSSESVRTWAVNRVGNTYAKQIDAQDAGSISFDESAAAGKNIENGGTGLNWSDANGFNVSYGSSTDPLTQALLLGEQPLPESFTVSFKIKSSASRLKTAEPDRPNADEILYIGPMNNTNGQYVHVLRASGSSKNRLKIGTAANDNAIYSYNDIETIKGDGITYTLVFSKNTGAATTNVKVYKNGKIVEESTGSDHTYPAGADVELPANSRIILNGLKDTYNGQDIFVDNVYIFNEALSASDVGTLYNDYQNNADVKTNGETQAQPWTLTPTPDTPTDDPGLPYFTVGESTSATARIDEDIATKANRAGWYYVTSDSHWSDILKVGTAKYMHAIRDDVKNGSDIVPYYYDGYETGTTDVTAEGKLNSEIAPDGTPEGKYFYYQPDTFEPIKFFLDDQGHLCCFYSTGGGGMDRNGWSHVYLKKDTTRVKSEVLQHALGRFVTKMNENSPGSRVSAVRFSSENFGDEDPDYSMFNLLNWTEPAQNAVDAISILNRERGDGSETNGITANDDGQYNYVLTGNTSTAAGFKAYNECLADDADPDEKTKKYIILFTDGKDTDLTDALKTDGADINELLDPENTSGNALEAVTLAKDLRDAGYTILCVMLSGGSVARGSEDYNQSIQFLAAIAGEKYEEGKIPANYDEKAEGNTDSTGKYNNIFEGHNSEEITEAFSEDIVGRIADNLESYTIKDYIDPRFNLVDTNGNVWKLEKGGKVTVGSGDAEDISEGGRDITLRSDEKIEGNSAKLYYDGDKNMYYLEWDGATIPGCSEGVNTLSVWNAEVTVKAKDDFIGGNAVITNGNVGLENYVYSTSDTTGTTSGTGDTKRVMDGDNITDYPSKGFPRTAVNVKVPEIEITEDKQVIFMGEELTNEGVARKLGESIRDMWKTEGVETSRSAWYWNYLKRYAEYNRDTYTDPADSSKEPFDVLLEEIIETASSGKAATYDYFYIPNVGEGANTQTGEDKGNHEKDKLGTLTFTWQDITAGYSEYPEGGITSDTSPRRSELTVTYTPLTADGRKGEVSIVDEKEGDANIYQWDLDFKPAPGSEQTGTLDATGPYTTNIVSGEIAFEMELPKDVVEYLQTYAPGQTVTYTAKLIKKGAEAAMALTADEEIGTYTAAYKVPDEPDANPAAVTVPAEIVYNNDMYTNYGLPMGDYVIKPIGGIGFGINFDDSVTNVALTGTTSGFSSFDANTTKTADEILNPPATATTHTVDEFAAETYADGTIKIGRTTSDESGDYRDKRYAMGSISASIDPTALSISKQVVNAPASDANKEFTFTITLDGSETAENETYDYDGNPTAVSGSASDKKIKFTNGTATVTLKNAESITIKGIQPSTKYTVSEDAYGDYTKTVTSTATDNSESGTISADAASAVAYTNTYSSTPQPDTSPSPSANPGTSPSPSVNPGTSPSPSANPGTETPNPVTSPSPSANPGTETPNPGTSPSPSANPGTETPNPVTSPSPSGNPGTTTPTPVTSPSPSGNPGTTTPKPDVSPSPSSNPGTATPKPGTTPAPTRKPGSSTGGGGFKPSSSATRTPAPTVNPTASPKPTPSVAPSATLAPGQTAPTVTNRPIAPTQAPQTNVPLVTTPTQAPQTNVPLVTAPTQAPSAFVPAAPAAPSVPTYSEWIPPRWEEGPAENETPKTGDNNMPALWITLSVLFAAGALISIYKLTKKRD